MTNRFFVDYKRHNKLTDGWAYKTEMSTESLEEAITKFHSLCSQYRDPNTFDYLCVSVTDLFGNVIKNEVWEHPAEPEPEPEPEEDATE